MKNLIIVLISLFFASAVLADGGNSGLSSMKIGVGARALGMGEACVALPDYTSSGYYNPAVIAGTDQSKLLLMHRQWIQDITTEYLSGTLPMGSFNLGVQVLTTAIPDIEVRTQPGDPEATFTARDFSIGTTAAVKLSDELWVGGTLKYVFEKIFVDEWSGLGYDLGLLYTIPATGISAGLSLLNGGSVTSGLREKIELPMSYRGGLSYSFPVESLHSEVLLAADAVQFVHEGIFHFHAGGELVYDKFLAVRAGYQSGYDIRSFTGGIGLRYGVITVDYSMVPFQKGAGTSHVFSLGLTF
jgi:hypothetical protein